MSILKSNIIIVYDLRKKCQTFLNEFNVKTFVLREVDFGWPPVCTGITRRDTRVNFALSVTPEHRRSQVNPRVDRESRRIFRFGESSPKATYLFKPILIDDVRRWINNTYGRPSLVILFNFSHITLHKLFIKFTM